MSIPNLSQKQKDLIDGFDPAFKQLGLAALLQLIIDGVNAAGTIEASEIASNAVTTAKINDSAVTTAKLAANAVTAAKMQANLATKQVRIAATNAVALGLTDVSAVVSILAFVTSSGAASTKHLLDLTTDFTVASGDITPVGNHSSETWVITYRPS